MSSHASGIGRIPTRGSGGSRRATLLRLLRISTALLGLALAALAGGVVLNSQPLLALALPAVLLTAVACIRHPVPTMVGAFFITGTYGSLTALTPVPTGVVIDLVLAGLLVSAVLRYLLVTRRESAWLWPGVAAAAGYLLLTAFEVLTAETPFLGLQAFRASTWYMLAFLLIAYAGWDSRTHERIARGVVLVAAFVGAYAAFRWIAGPADAELELANNNRYNFVDGDLRTFGSFSSGHQLGFWTACAVPFCLAVALTHRDRWRWLAAAAASLCMVGLLASGVRTSLASVVVGGALTFVLFQAARAFGGLHLGASLLGLLAAVVVGGGAFAVTAGDSPESKSRYEAILSPTQDLAYQDRVYKWNAALDDIDEHPLGRGLGTAGRTQDRFGRFSNIANSNIDNSYLKIALEQGFAVMMFFIIAMLVLLAGLAMRAMTTLDRRKAGIAIGSCGALASFLILLLTGVYIEDLIALGAWMLVGLGVGQFAIRNDHRQVPGERA